jgi:hypothetical protein
MWDRKTVAAAAMVILFLSGCMGPDGDWMFPSLMTPPSYVSRQYRYIPSSGHRRRHRAIASARSSDKHYKEVASVTDSAAPKWVRPSLASAPDPPAPQPDVTLADGEASLEEALRFLNGAETTLAQVNRKKLSGEQVSTYQQANNFIQEGRAAGGQGDYVAASGYGRKALALANLLTASPH